MTSERRPQSVARTLALAAALLTGTAAAQTPWERYLDEPTSGNARGVDAIEYTAPPAGGYDADDLEILKLQVLAMDAEAYRLAHRLYERSTGGALSEELAAILASVIRPHPGFFLRHVEELDPTCADFNVGAAGLAYVDRELARNYELQQRRDAIMSVADPALDAIRAACLARLDAS